MRQRRLVTLARRAFIVCATVIAPTWSSDIVRSHTHVEADGSTVSWYPKDCCDNGDCRPVIHIQAVGAGLWMTTVDGATILVGPRDMRRPSRDMRWHICLAKDPETQGTQIRCLFEPANM